MNKVRINLLPKDILEKRKAEHLLVLVLVGIGAFFAVLAVVYGFNVIRIMNEQADLELLQAENSRYEREITRIADFENNKILVEQREQLVNAAIARKYSWSKFLNNISLIVPNEVWLSALSGGKDGVIQFSGQALAESGDTRMGQKSVAKWLVHLSEIEDIGDVWLSQSTKDSGPARELPPGALIESPNERDMMTFETNAIIKSLSEDDILSAPAPPASGGQT